MSFLTNLIPAPYRILALVLLAVALVAFGWVKGAQHSQHRIDAMVAKAATEGVRIAKARDVVTERVVTKFLPQVIKQQVATETTVKEIHAHANPADPAVPGSFRVWHDAAATGGIPDTARLADASAVPLEDASSVVAENYGTCRKDQLTLKGLQEWVSEQGKVK